MTDFNRCELSCSSSCGVVDFERLQKALLMLKGAGEPVSFRAGQTLLYQDHVPVGCFLLEHGEWDCERQDQSGVLSTDPCERRLVGLLHLLNQTPLCSSVVARTRVTTIFFARPFILELLAKHHYSSSTHLGR